MHRRTLIIGVSILVIAAGVGGWIYYTKYRRVTAPVTYHKDFPAIFNATALPSLAIRFYMLGDTIAVISGHHETKDTQSYDEVLFTTATPRTALYDAYLAHFAGLHWTVTSSSNISEIATITAKNSNKWVSVSLKDNGPRTEARVSLLGPITSPLATPAPTPNIDPSKLK